MPLHCAPWKRHLKLYKQTLLVSFFGSYGFGLLLFFFVFCPKWGLFFLNQLTVRGERGSLVYCNQ